MNPSVFFSENNVDYPIDNPCTQDSLSKDVMRHSHPYDPTKFLQVYSLLFRTDLTKGRKREGGHCGQMLTSTTII